MRRVVVSTVSPTFSGVSLRKLEAMVSGGIVDVADVGNYVVENARGFDRTIGRVLGERCKKMDYREVPEENLKVSVAETK